MDCSTTHSLGRKNDGGSSMNDDNDSKPDILELAKILDTEDMIGFTRAFVKDFQNRNNLKELIDHWAARYHVKPSKDSLKQNSDDPLDDVPEPTQFNLSVIDKAILYFFLGILLSIPEGK